MQALGLSLFKKEVCRRGGDRLVVTVEPDPGDTGLFHAYCGGSVYTSAFVNPHGDKRKLNPPPMPWKTEWVPYEDAKESALNMVDHLKELGFAE
jgi:hypothetical protein